MYRRVFMVLIALIYPLAIWRGHQYIHPHLLVPLQLYPFLMNFIMLCVFGYSLIFPPTVVERIARLQEPNLPTIVTLYTRRVTQVWCVFFVINGGISLVTTFCCTPAIWSLYNGVIAYILMGILFGGEYLIRLRFKRRHHV